MIIQVLKTDKLT